MRSPFSDSFEMQESPLVMPTSEVEMNSPWTDQFIPEMESELSGAALESAVRLNEQYKTLYGWGDFIPLILPHINVVPADQPRNIIDPREFAKSFAKWQESQGFKGTNPGVLGLNNWTYLQKKMKFHNLSNVHGIDISKAVSSNNSYEQKIWKDRRTEIYRWLANARILPMALPVNDEYFAYAIADFQKQKGIKVDGILGPNTFAALQTTPAPPPAPKPVSLTPSKWHTILPNAVQSPTETFVNGNDAFRKMVEIIRTANQKDHFIYLLSGWGIDIDFCMLPNTFSNLADTSSSLRNLLTVAGKAGVEIKIISWNNPQSLGDISKAETFIKELRSGQHANAVMIRDNLTYGTEMMKALLTMVRTKMAVLDPVLNRFDEWNTMYAKAKAFPNEGSHHEKILVIKGSRGLFAFCGGMDLDANRIMGLKGFCCGVLTNPVHNCDLDSANGVYNQYSRIMHDVHCMVEGKAAVSLLQRFINRWNLHPLRTTGQLASLPLPSIPAAAAIVPSTPFVKVLHTFNHHNNPTKTDRSILKTVKAAIAVASQSVLFEDQYMISPEIADIINKAVRVKPNLRVTIHTQDDSLAGADLMFPQKFRSRFFEYLYKGLDAGQKARIEVMILDPSSTVPNRRRVHSKTYIFDDELAIIGSANCNRRSMTFDSETAVAFFQDGDPSQETVVRKLKADLLRDTLNKWIPYKRNLTGNGMDLDVKMYGNKYFYIAYGLAAALQLGQPLRVMIDVAMILLQRAIDPYPLNEPDLIVKEMEESINEIRQQNELLELEASGSVAQESEQVESFERELEFALEASPAKCEGRNCWGKSVLNQLLALNLPLNNTMDPATRQALRDFQFSNQLPLTQNLDFVTERALLEAAAVQKHRNSPAEKDTVRIIAEAKTKIEDWMAKGVSGVKTKPQHILNSFRDPRTIWAFVLHQMAFKRSGRGTGVYSDPESYLNTGSHFCILLDGRIVQLHPFSRMIWHGNCLSPRSVAVEFEGNFPDIKGRWWVDKKSKVQNRDMPTPAQFEAGRFLASYLKLVLGTTHIMAHRQSSSSRTNDPGPAIWSNVGEWAIQNLGMTDGGASFKCGTGNPILPEWRSWSGTTGNKEYDEEAFPESELLSEYETIAEGEDWEDYQSAVLHPDPMTEGEGPEWEEEVIYDN